MTKYYLTKIIYNGLTYFFIWYSNDEDGFLLFNQRLLVFSSVEEANIFADKEHIIFEKGIKPVKANKFYYFKHPMAKKMAELEISHNDIGEIDRGTWRKYNPYNPYVEDKTEEKVQNLKVESLDDLFEDENNAPQPEKKNEELKPQNLDLNSFEDEAPVLPQESEDDDTYDLQKELEAKFDELFGPIEDDDE